MPTSTTMIEHFAVSTRGHARRLLWAISLAGLLALFVAPTSEAAIITFGSPLSVPATLNTATDLSYLGTYTAVPPSPEAPTGLFHTPHFGADTALWNVTQAAGDPRVPATGQALQVSLEGCAEAAPHGPAPLTQIHFQDLSPLPGGGAQVNLSSQAFNIPVCGQGGAGPSKITTYEPTNLCVSAGDYVAFNDDGGYVENVYRAGVPYQVLGAVKGSTADSFVANNGTDNGAVLSSSDTAANDGFASNPGEELMMQVKLGTGPDATHICPGGSQGLPPVLPPVGIRPQTDGINHSRVVAVAIYCRVTPECKGVAMLKAGHGHAYGRAGFSVPANRTAHVPIRLAPEAIGLIRRHNGVSATFTALVAGRSFSQTITVKIF
ncbi:MAG: hypothetical protein ACLQMH_14355 [Solirubrobacteraceae bacterium]